MFFKKITLFVLLMSITSSCSWIRDVPKAQKNFQGGELDLSCLQKMPQQLQTLFSGHYTNSARDQTEVASVWLCLDRSLNTFSKYTHGANANYYTDVEMQIFANRYLPNDSLFSQSLVNAIFRLKKAVLGGSEDVITQNEIAKLRKKLSRFGEIIQPLSPYIGALLRPYNDNLKDGRMQAAADRLNKFVADFASLLADSENTVTWGDLSFFVSEVEKYLKAPNPTALTVVKEQIQVFQYLKVLLFGGDEFGIERTKWQPIFKSISTIYNALYMTTSTTEMMDQLAIDIQSTDAEQKMATQKLTGVLRVLKADDKLYSKTTIALLSDRWARALTINAFLYPKSQEKLEIKAFLGSATLRKLTGNLLNEMTQIKNGEQSATLIATVADQLSVLIEQTGIEQGSNISLANLREFLLQLKPLLASDNDYQIIDSAISILQDVSALAIGKGTETLSPKDFRALFQKASDLYTAWKGSDPVDFNKALADSLSILTRQPNAFLISVDQIQTLLTKCEQILPKMEIRSTFDWKRVHQMVTNGAKLKAILFANTDQNISNYELTQISNTLHVFSAKKDTDEALEDLANYFKNNPYSSIKVADLLSAIDNFLPDDQKLSKLGVTADVVGPLKTFLIGGTTAMLDRTEYSKLAGLAYTMYKNLNPVLRDLPNHFKLGLNSSTFAILEAAVEGLIDDKNNPYSNNALKELVVTELNKSGYHVQPKTIDKLLIGLNSRVFERNKGKKPSQFPATFDGSKLTDLKECLGKIKLDYQDLEKSFTDVDSIHSLPGVDLYKKLTRDDTKVILSSLHPIISGVTTMPYFAGGNHPQTDYYFIDLAYKDLIYHALLWLVPGYETQPDPTKPSELPRLSLPELTDLFEDLDDAVFELGLSFSPDPAPLAAKERMQTVNLFTRTGNGDDYMDVIETTDFLTTTFGGKNLLDEIRASLTKDCYPQNRDYTTQTHFSYSCLKNFFFSKEKFASFYHKVAPAMSDHYSTLSDADKESFRQSVLTAVKPGWKESSEMDLAGMETMVSIPYYVENIFIRLDHNYDGVLTFSEAMSGFPVFCGAIKEAAGSSVKGSCVPGEDPRQVEAIYGHLIIKGVPPRGNEPGDSIWTKIRTAKDFLLWVRQWNRLNKDPAVRDVQPPYLYRKDLLSIISNLSTTIAPPSAPGQPEPNASSDSAPLSGGQFVL